MWLLRLKIFFKKAQKSSRGPGELLRIEAKSWRISPKLWKPLKGTTLSNIPKLSSSLNSSSLKFLNEYLIVLLGAFFDASMVLEKWKESFQLFAGEEPKSLLFFRNFKELYGSDKEYVVWGTIFFFNFIWLDLTIPKLIFSRKFEFVSGRCLQEFCHVKV